MKFYVRVVRPRFEMQYVEVDAIDDDHARDQATKECRRRDGSWTTIDFSTTDYGCHIEECMSEDNLDANEMTPAAARAELSDPSTTDYRYLLLSADIVSGTGEVLFQPWLDEADVLLLDDLASDWKVELEMLCDDNSDDFMERPRPKLDEPSESSKQMLAAALNRRRQGKGGTPKA
jgi:hypothetical protein